MVSVGIQRVIWSTMPVETPIGLAGLCSFSDTPRCKAILVSTMDAMLMTKFLLINEVCQQARARQ